MPVLRTDCVTKRCSHGLCGCANFECSNVNSSTQQEVHVVYKLSTQNPNGATKRMEFDLIQ